MSNSHQIAKARDNINRTGGQAEFHGNDNTPVDRGANENRVIDLLEKHSRKDNQVGQQAQALVDHLGNAPRGWKVVSGVKKGGLGGNGNPPDMRQHITLDTGHHLRFNNKGQLMEITGDHIPEGKGRQRPSKPSEAENHISHLQETHGLTPQEALKAHRYTTHMDDTGKKLTENQAVAKVKSNRRK